MRLINFLKFYVEIVVFLFHPKTKSCFFGKSALKKYIVIYEYKKSKFTSLLLINECEKFLLDSYP